MDQLSRIGFDSNGRFVNGQADVEQCNKHPPCPMDGRRHQEFFLNTPLKRFKHIKLQLTNLPEDIITYYKLQEKATPEGFICVEVRKGMFGLSQAGLLVQELLEKRLNEKGFIQSRYTPGLWTHTSKSIKLTLVVDDFGV